MDSIERAINLKVSKQQLDGKGKNIVIDNIRNYIYVFDESWLYLLTYDFEPIKSLEAVNGTLEIEENNYGTYSTGAKVILKDKEGTIVKEFYIIIFEDVDGDSLITCTDSELCMDLKQNKGDCYNELNHYNIYAIININDCKWMCFFEGKYEYEINQFTRKLELID